MRPGRDPFQHKAAIRGRCCPVAASIYCDQRFRNRSPVGHAGDEATNLTRFLGGGWGPYNRQQGERA